MCDKSGKSESKTRLLGDTEQNWCKAVAGGTGITILALQVSREPNISVLQNVLYKIQNDHPVLKSMLQKNPSTGTFSFIPSPTPHLQLKITSPSKTLELLRTLTSQKPSNVPLSPLHLIVEHEMNINEWSDVPTCSGCMGGVCTCFANTYTLADEKWVLVLRLHSLVCDQTTAVSLLKELKVLIWEGKGEGGGTKGGIGYKDEVNLGIEELIPTGKAKKTMWAHGKDMLAYSVNSLRLTNLKFKDVNWPRHSEFVRLKMNKQETLMILAGCKSRGIKLCGALAAAVLIAAHSTKQHRSYYHRKYGAVFLTDCRSTLRPPLSSQSFGFYHSAISTIQEVKGGENLWDLAMRSYMAFASSKNSNKHFSDMADLNYLMSKAIDNPSLTPSSSLRSSLVAIFEDPVIGSSTKIERDLGLDDYIGCSSIHGIGPSIGIFDTIRDGELDCACVYPSPLHSREQMQELVANMKTNLLQGIKMEEKLQV